MSVVEEIRSRLDIVDVIGSYVKLTRSGRNYKGLSPFKQERTPSFFVFPDTQTFKDFSSGEQGDVFTFVMKIEGWTFREALQELARRAGVSLEERTPEQQRAQSALQRLREALHEAMAYFHQLLLSAPQAQICRDYLLKQRRLSEDSIRAWKLGYSLPDYHALSAYLTEKGFAQTELVDAGLVVENEEGRRYDRFRGRLIIPICDLRGQVVGFGSRSLDGSEPKYMNSPQTAVFDKGRLLFGLERARHAIRQAGEAVLVEGYMDVIACHQAGFTNVVAGMGTSLTDEQFTMLRRLAPRIVLALDADAGGQRAVLRSLDVARESAEREVELRFDPRGALRAQLHFKVDLRVAMLPDNRDPDEIVLSDPQQWRSVIASAAPIVEYVLDAVLSQFNLADAVQKSAALRAVAPILLDATDAVQRDTYVQQLARRLGVTVRAVAQTLSETEREQRHKGRGEATPRYAKQPAASSPPSLDLELHLIALLLRHPQMLIDANVALTRAGLDVLSEKDFADAALRQGFHALSRHAIGHPTVESSDDDTWLALVADYDPTLVKAAPSAQQELSRLLREDAALVREEVVRTALRLRERNAAREQQALVAMIEQLRETQDWSALQHYNLQLRHVTTQRLRAQRALQLRNELSIF